MILYMLKTTTIFAQLAPKQRKLKRFIRVTWFTTFKHCFLSKFLQALSTILTNQCQNK